MNRSAVGGLSQPAPEALGRAVEARARRFPRLVPERVPVRRVVAALVSFTDDYAGPFPAEAFDDRVVRACLDHVAERQAVTVPDLLDAPPLRARGTFLEAALAMHAALRQLARGRDGRALPSCRMSLEERLRIGRGVLPFPAEVSRGGDPLGDAYHYAANLAIGTLLACRRPGAALPAPLFAVGPELMWLVRQNLFGAPLFFGNHAAIDRMGLIHGARVAGVRRASGGPRPPAGHGRCATPPGWP